MANNQTVCNSPLSTTQSDYVVETVDQGDGVHRQVVQAHVWASGVAVSESAPMPVSISSGLVPEGYDTLALGYSGDDLTSVAYSSGGSTIATLALGYSGGKLVSVTRT